MAKKAKFKLYFKDSNGTVKVIKHPLILGFLASKLEEIIAEFNRLSSKNHIPKAEEVLTYYYDIEHFVKFAGAFNQDPSLIKIKVKFEAINADGTTEIKNVLENRKGYTIFYDSYRPLCNICLVPENKIIKQLEQTSNKENPFL
jgi:hypothetical protein